MQALKASFTDLTGGDANSPSELLVRVAGKDVAAFQELYNATSAKLFGTVLRILRTKDRAEDAMQEIYLKIWERADRFELSKGSAIAWMTTVARNHALDDVRRNATIPQASELLPDSAVAQGVDLIALREAADNSQRLLSCLKSLETEKQQMILLAYQFGLSRDELSTRFGHPVATVKTWLRRGLQSLKDCLSS